MVGAGCLVPSAPMEFRRNLNMALRHSVSKPVIDTSITRVTRTNSLAFSCPALALILLLLEEVKGNL